MSRKITLPGYILIPLIVILSICILLPLATLADALSDLFDWLLPKFDIIRGWCFDERFDEVDI